MDHIKLPDNYLYGIEDRRISDFASRKDIRGIFKPNYFYIENPTEVSYNFYWDGWQDYPLQWSIDRDNWYDITSSDAIDITGYSKLYLRGNNSSYEEEPGWVVSKIGGTALFNVGGNMGSLVDGADFNEETEVDSYGFCLFFYDKDVLYAHDLVLPRGGSAAYSEAFHNCENLKTMPYLRPQPFPETYESMFGGCISLQETSVLPVVTGLSNYYANIFSGCEALKIVHTEFTSGIAANSNHQIDNWLYGVSNKGIIYSYAPTSAWEADSASGIPTGWKNIELSY